MVRMEMGAAVLGVVALAFVLGAGADGSDHKYKEGDYVPLYANKVGPFHNPSETYRYYDLPFCAPEHPKDKREALGEVLNGDRLVDAPYELNFKEDKNSKELCKKTLSMEQVVKLRDAVAKDYYFQIMEKYSKSSSMPQHLEIHWFSIINSCVTVLLLTGFLATILMRVLKNDFVKYSHEDESLEDQEETGWKYIHGDIFRFPQQKSLFAAIVGSGTQLLALAIFIFLLAIVGVFYPYNRGALFTALVVIYALTSGIAGYTATSFYLQLEGTNWVRNLIFTGCLFWFLPFSAIYIELYYIFASVWGHKIYTIYSILFIVFIILIIVTAFVTVALTYFQLAVEDHEWWWRSILCGGSTGIFIFFYCIYYYHARSDMSGFMQTSFFFGYMTCVCYGFFLMLGTVGFHASLLFVRHIYRSIKFRFTGNAQYTG
ncbi:hypothetical protein GUJ93_ZPchr0010g7735 [Zizania palustris]|uniref:Transmembrane 9 superfamily member n=1 Tax=Zizania palustris TaxID=103762 RepID=A0A8J5WEN2_ZIZPA|nr:hypothetical protein GUJ93_ZPchr0010g7735 [Zizania palustris]KAG8086845.1 hypothetical protein GUJ93_ZPchr0010g7735 [Zizania palustris]